MRLVVRAVKDKLSMGASWRIALIGQLGTGKSHVAKMIRDATGAELVSFGGEVYRVAEAAIGRSVDKSLHADRTLLTDVGTHWGRNGDPIDRTLEAKLSEIWPHNHGYPDIWVDALDRRLQAENGGKNFVLDDLRFENELRFLTKNKFQIFLLLCSVATRHQRLQERGDPYAVTVDSHPSEALATWLTDLSRPKLVVPTIWNDVAPPEEYLDGTLLTTPDELIERLRASEGVDMLQLHANNQAWARTIKGFQKVT